MWSLTWLIYLLIFNFRVCLPRLLEKVCMILERFCGFAENWGWGGSGRNCRACRFYTLCKIMCPSRERSAFSQLKRGAELGYVGWAAVFFVQMTNSIVIDFPICRKNSFWPPLNFSISVTKSDWSTLWPYFNLPYYGTRNARAAVVAGSVCFAAAVRPAAAMRSGAWLWN